MQKQIEPTYLRYIYDSLSLNTIHKDNISALPEGLIGMYEESLSNEQNVSNKERFLSFFAAWSLLKKEVSTSLMAELLEWEEQEVIDFLSHYTKWFNSPSSGKYLLYHERLRVFFLQKISSHQLDQTNESIISKCQSALEKRNGDEWEVYALEHLPSHLLIAAMQSEADGVDFKKLVYDTSFWNRQIEISKGYNWSKRMLNQSMTWAAKENTDELIECALNKIDLHHMEQNDAPRIVELVAQNDIETALQRIESFGGNDKEGLQRKFILYMLCLMELTLLDSKDKPFRRDTIQKILKHFDEEMPIDHSILNWDDFFPSYLMFKMACDWNLLQLDYLIVFKRTGWWDFSWIEENSPYYDLQLEVIIACTQNVIDKVEKATLLAKISTVLDMQEMINHAESLMENAYICANQIIDENYKQTALKAIYIELVKQGKITQALERAKRTIDISDRGRALFDICTEMAKHGNITQSFECAMGIEDEDNRLWALRDISIEASKQGIFNQAIDYARNIDDKYNKIWALMDISCSLKVHGKAKQASTLIIDANNCIQGIADDYWKSRALSIFASKLAKHEKYDQAFDFANQISDIGNKSGAYCEISIELAKNGKFDKAIECARQIINKKYKSRALNSVAIELYKQEKTEQATLLIQESINVARGISTKHVKNSILIQIFTELSKQGEIDVFLSFFYLFNGDDRSKAIKNTFTEYLKVAMIKDVAMKMQLALKIVPSYIDDDIKAKALVKISAELTKLGQIEQAIGSARSILFSDFIKSKLMGDLATILSKNRMDKEAELVIIEALECVQEIDQEEYKSSSLIYISSELIRQGKLINALSTIRSFSDGSDKVAILTKISSELNRLGHLDKSEIFMLESLDCLSNITHEYDKSIASSLIASELAKQGKLNHALNYVSRIKENSEKSIALWNISIEMAKQEKFKESLELANSIRNNFHKAKAFKDISDEMINKGKLRKASSVMQKAIEYAYEIRNDYERCSMLVKISFELTRLGKSRKAASVIQKAIENTQYISNDYQKCSLLKKIVIVLAKQGKWGLVEKYSLAIPHTSEQRDCWKKIAIEINNQDGWQTCFKKISNIKNDYSLLFYLKGLVENIELINVNEELLDKLINKIIDDSISLENILQLYALNQIFFEKPIPEKIARLNRTLNIQWAIDITNNFNKN